MRSRYAPLARHLETVIADAVTLTFADIENILGFPLPPSARAHGPWWSNGASNAVWTKVGWKSEGRDIREQRVTFRRVIPGDEVRPTRTAIPVDSPALSISDFAPKVDVVIRFEWKHLGDVTFSEAGGLGFPKAPTAPGLYRMMVRRGNRLEVYVGEAVKLRRRFGNYRNPGLRQKTSIRINALLRDALATGASVSIDIVDQDIVLVVAGIEIPVDLGDKVVRRLAEEAAIVVHGGIDVAMLNR